MSRGRQWGIGRDRITLRGESISFQHAINRRFNGILDGMTFLPIVTWQLSRALRSKARTQPQSGMTLAGGACGAVDVALLIVSFRIGLALKVSTRRPLMIISSPVFGFLPRRGFLPRTTKLPKPEILTFSPFSKQLFMISKVASTTSVAWFLEKPTFSSIRAMISAFVMDS